MAGDGVAPDGRREAHLTDCPYCRVYLEEMRRRIRPLGMLTEPSLDPEAKVELLRRFRDWRHG